jgi:hypothetical protein
MPVKSSERRKTEFFKLFPSTLEERELAQQSNTQISPIPAESL